MASNKSKSSRRARVSVTPRTPEWQLGLALIVLAFVAYFPAWHAGFLWDDNVLLTDNPIVHASDGLWRIWFGKQPLDYFPLTYTTFWIEWHLWGNNPCGYHLINILLHGIGAILLWRVGAALRVTKPWLVAAIFVLHPVDVASVAWIAERKNTLSFPLYLASVLLFLRFESLNIASKTPRRINKPNGSLYYIFSLAAFILAALSKTSVIMLPVVLLLCAWWQRKCITKRDAWRVAPFFGVSLVFGFITVFFQNAGALSKVKLDTGNLATHIASAGCSVWFYLSKALLPIDLMMIYPHWKIDSSIWFWYLPTSTLIAVFLVLWFKRHSWGRAPLFGLSYYVISLFPVIGFFQMSFMYYAPVADHLQYVALPGVIALCVATVERFVFRKNLLAPGIEKLLWSVVLALLAWLTWQQTATYISSNVLWETNIQRNPECWIAYKNLGDAFNTSGQTDKAIDQFQKALKYQPSDAMTHNNLGNAFLTERRVDEAVAQFKTALKLQPGDTSAHNNYGNALLENGELNEAIIQFKESLAADPHNAPARNNLANALCKAGDFEGAMTQLRKAIEIDPGDATARSNLGNAYLQAGRITEAIAEFGKALQIQPNDAATHNNLGSALLQRGSFSEAAAEFQKALQLTPNDAKAYYNLGNCLLQEGHSSEAAASYKQAIKIQPDSVWALNSLAWLLATSSDNSLRNGNNALAMALQANQLTGGRNPLVLHTLAAAYAETGQFAQALETALTALHLAETESNNDLMQALQAEISRYQSGTPCRSDY